MYYFLHATTELPIGGKVPETFTINSRLNDEDHLHAVRVQTTMANCSWHALAQKSFQLAGKNFFDLQD